MRKASLYSYITPMLLIATTFGQGVQTLAVDKPSAVPDGNHHHRTLCKVLGANHFHLNHFVGTGDHPDYDLQKHITTRAAVIHAENLRSLQQAASSSSSPGRSWFGWVPSFRSSPTSSSTPSIRAPLQVGDFVPDNFEPDNLAPIYNSAASLAAAGGSIPPQSSKDLTTRSSLSRTPDYLGLALSGGGGRGFMEALEIEYIEKITNTPIAELFDYIGGTSVGGLWALGASLTNDEQTPILSGSGMVSLLKTHFLDIFPNGSDNIAKKLWCDAVSIFYSQYNPAPFESLLQKTFGNLTLAHSLTNVMVTAVNTNLDIPVFLDSRLTPNFPAWQSGRCTAAAPTYYPSFQPPPIDGVIQPYFADGGLYCNDPGFEVLKKIQALAQAKQQPFDFSQVTLLSLGTGVRPIDPKLPPNAGMLAAASIIEVLLRTQEAGTDMTLRSLLPARNYIRLNPILTTNIPLDQLTPEIVTEMTAAAETQFEALDAFADSEPVRRRLEKKGSGAVLQEH